LHLLLPATWNVSKTTPQYLDLLVKTVWSRGRQTRLLLLLLSTPLWGCDSLPISGSYSANDVDAGFKHAQEAIEREDWAAAYRHLEHNLNESDPEVKESALTLVEQHPLIADAARDFFSFEGLSRYKQGNPDDFLWAKTRLDIYQSSIANPQESLRAKENFEQVYVEEAARHREQVKQILDEHEDRTNTHKQAEKLQKRSQVICRSMLFDGVCLGDSIDQLLARIKPMVDIASGRYRKVVFEGTHAPIGVLSRDGKVEAVMVLIQPASWLEFATQKLRLEHTLDVKWVRNVKLPSEAKTIEAREEAIRLGQGHIRLTSQDRFLKLSFVGPEGIRLEHVHPNRGETGSSDNDDDLWTSTGMLPLLVRLQSSVSVELAGAQDGAQPAVSHGVAVLLRPGTSVFKDLSGGTEAEIEQHFRSCVAESIRSADLGIRLIEGDEVFVEEDGKPLPGFSDPLSHDVDTLVLVDGTTYAEGENTGLSCADAQGSGICAGQEGLFMCAAGYTGFACLGLARFQEPYRLVVTVVDTSNWRVVWQHEVTTSTESRIVGGYVIPFWWTFGPDSDECTKVGREVAEYLAGDLKKESTAPK